MQWFLKFEKQSVRHGKAMPRHFGLLNLFFFASRKKFVSESGFPVVKALR